MNLFKLRNLPCFSTRNLLRPGAIFVNFDLFATIWQPSGCEQAVQRSSASLYFGVDANNM